MLFRAVFWVGLLSVVMPREPDLGFGRPNPGDGLTSAVAGMLQSYLPRPVVHTGPIDQKQVLRTLAQVKAEIAAARRGEL